MTYRKLSHAVWECKYHVVYIHKYRKARILFKLKSYLGCPDKSLIRESPHSCAVATSSLTK